MEMSCARMNDITGVMDTAGFGSDMMVLTIDVIVVPALDWIGLMMGSERGAPY